MADIEVTPARGGLKLSIRSGLRSVTTLLNLADALTLADEIYRQALCLRATERDTAINAAGSGAHMIHIEGGDNKHA